MPKINKEEYEVLKELDDKWKWKWITRIEEGAMKTFISKPFKNMDFGRSGSWDIKGNEDHAIYTTYSDLFQFIQWEDEEPYNITELIEGYEFENVLSDKDQFEEWDHATESEEAEVNKYTDWIEKEKFKEKIERKRWEECSGAGEYRNGKADAYEVVLNIIDQLDKPEVLSKEWIDNNSINASHDGVTEEYVHVDDLENLLVPTISEMETVDITEGQVMDWLDNNYFYHHTTAETVLANAVDKGELGYYGTKYFVVKKPAIPKYVAKYLEFAKSDVSLMRVMVVAYSRDELPEWEKEYDWISANDEAFAQAWFLGYEVEEEPKYYIVDKNDEVLWYRDNKGIPSLSGSTLRSVLKSNSKDRYQFTEQEIKDYDERFWPFAGPVEVTE